VFPRADSFPLEPSEDARLVERCLGGDVRAWEALVRRHERLVYAIGRSYRLSDDDLGDVFQEVFAALIRGLPRLREPRTLVRWLSSTTQRIARATALKRRREQALSVELDGATPPALTVGEPAAAEALERLEEQALVRLALASLSERCRNLLGALYFEDPAPSYEALSRRLGVPIGSLGPTRARCFERLRGAYERLQMPAAGISERDAATFETESPGTDRVRFSAPTVKPRDEAAAMKEHP
jgi:RNA polymerase sigma factor (sigma-70 family)